MSKIHVLAGLTPDKALPVSI